jgi:hypothetical protein
MNSKDYYAIYHPEYLLDLLSAGAVFPKSSVFQLPAIESDKALIKEFIQNQLPLISSERYEIWLKFKTEQNVEERFLSLNNIESAHFYSRSRQETTPDHVINALTTFRIAIKDPVQERVDHILQEHDKLVREKVALNICRAWFESAVSLSTEFIEQVKTGFEHQQSATPEALPTIHSENVWARLVAYNPGLRKFEEKPSVLPLQDLQEVLKRSDQNFRDQLKLVSDNHYIKLSDVIQKASENVASGTSLSNWIIEETGKRDSYLSELNGLLGRNLNQPNFLYSALLYLSWRDKILNKDYAGALMKNDFVRPYLKNAIDNLNRQAIAEALFTITYAGGPRIFQHAQIEARIKVLKLLSVPSEGNTEHLHINQQKNGTEKRYSARLFSDSVKKRLAKFLSNIYDSKKKDSDTKEQVKEILKINELRIGKFTHDQYVKLCEVLKTDPETFDDIATSESVEHEMGSSKLNTGTIELGFDVDLKKHEKEQKKAKNKKQNNKSSDSEDAKNDKNPASREDSQQTELGF